jgi:hypothetical protein
MSSIRQQIMDALATRLATITTANGYQTSAGSKVFVWRKHPVTPAEVPCLLVQDTDLARDYNRLVGQAENRLTVEIVAAAKGSTTAAEARAIEADIVKCLAGWETAGGLADWLLVEKTALVMEQHEEMVGAAQITVAIAYTTERNLC